MSSVVILALITALCMLGFWYIRAVYFRFKHLLLLISQQVPPTKMAKLVFFVVALAFVAVVLAADGTTTTNNGVSGVTNGVSSILSGLGNTLLSLPYLLYSGLLGEYGLVPTILNGVSYLVGGIGKGLLSFLNGTQLGNGIYSLLSTIFTLVGGILGGVFGTAPASPLT